MTDREAKLIAITLFIIDLVGIITVILAARQDIEKEEQCDAKNGVVVRTSKGWKCIEGKYL